jgi:hypothetical protein
MFIQYGRWMLSGCVGACQQTRIIGLEKNVVHCRRCERGTTLVGREMKICLVLMLNLAKRFTKKINEVV